MNARFHRIVLFGTLLLGLTLVATSPAQAQATRTWVSGTGDDVNPCSRTAPCKTFAGAISKTAAGGEINCLDPGGFGTVTIIKSITIDCVGTNGSILASGTTGVVVNGAGVNVILRNLQINGAGNAIGNGIRVINARNVVVENVTIENFAGTATNGRGIAIETTAAGVSVQVINSRVFNNGFFGIVSAPTAGDVTLTVSGTSVLRGGSSAIALLGNTRAAVSNNVLSHNGGAGVALQDAATVAHISNNLISFNDFGIANGLAGASTARLYGNVITANGNGVRIDAGSVSTHGNNAIRGNGGNETPTQPSIGEQ